MYPRREEGSDRYGYWARNGWAIDPQFCYAHTFVSGYAAVELADGRYGLIETDGTLHPLDAICGGRTPIRDEEISCFTGFGDCDSQPSRYATVWTENRGRREWGLIDTNLAYRPLADDVFSTADHVKTCGDYVVVIRDHGPGHESSWGLFNLSDMRLELPVEYWCVYPSRESIWVVARAIGDHQQRSAFYDVRKREFISGWFWEAVPFSCGFGAIREGEMRGRSYFVDESLRPAFDADFDDVGRFSYGLAAVYKGSDAGYIDTTGRMRLLLPYVDMEPFNRFGLALANRDDLEWDIDVIDRTGRPRLAGLESASFWDGDFPHYTVTMSGEDHLFDVDLNMIF